MTTFQNPYESIGLLHNEAMDFVPNYLGPSFPNATEAQYFEALKAFAASKGETFNTTLEDQRLRLASVPITVKEHVASELIRFTSLGNLSSQLSQDIQSVFDAVFSMEETGDEGLEGILQSISNLEENVFNNPNYNTDDKDQLLKVGALARNSLTYWVDVQANSNHPRHHEFLNPGTPVSQAAFRPWWKIRRAAVDTWGWVKEIFGDPLPGSSTPTQTGRSFSNEWERNHP